MSINKKINAKKSIRNLTGHISFGEVLNSFRVSKELSQVEMAKALGVSKQDLCNIEKGRKIVSIERAVKFAKSLKYSPTVFAKYVIEDQLRRAGLPNQIKIEDVA